MYLFKRRKVVRTFLLLITLILALAITGIVMADGPTPPGPPKDGPPPMGGPMKGEMPMGKPMMPMGSCIKGEVIYDGNHNGKLDSNEDPMDGAVVTVHAVVHMGKLKPMGQSIARDGGMYAVCGLPPGQYVVAVEPPASHVKADLVLTKGHNPTKPITLEMGKNQFVWFGFGLPRCYDPNAMLNNAERTYGKTGVDG